MTNQPTPTTKPTEVGARDRYEEVLLCAPDGKKPVAFVPTIKWMETVRAFKQDEQGREVEQVLGFLVTVPPRKALKIYSHVCRETAKHAEAAARLAAGKTGKFNLPAVWNGHYEACPLCNPPKPTGKEKAE